MNIDKRTLKVGQKVIVMITGCVESHRGTVTGHDSREGMAIVTIDDGSPTWNGAELKREDYIVVEIVDESEPGDGAES